MGLSPLTNRRDPLAEAPEVVWYVRPPSGGQFGPADAEVMRAWLGEGRIGVDSLVWREGWGDWQAAGDVFPQLSPPPPASGLDAVVSTRVVVTPLRSRPVSNRGRMRANTVWIVVIGSLTLAAIAIFFTLHAVLSNK